MNRASRTFPVRSRRRLAAATAGLGLGLVAALPTAAAEAATGPRVDLAEAAASLPSAAELPPGTVSSAWVATVARPTGLSPCSLAGGERFNLHDNGAAIGIYSTPQSAPVAQLAQWVVSTRVFASSKAAHAAVTRLVAAERRCPKVARSKDMAFRRTWSGRYVTAGGWHGYHTVDIIKVTGRRTQLRHIAVYLQRGNALIQVDEIATVTAGNARLQEGRRLAVQKTLAARVTAAAAS